MPSGRLLEKQMTDKHHNEVNNRKNVEHLEYLAILVVTKKLLHDRGCNSLSCTESCNSKSCCQTLPILEPEHQGLNR